MQQLSHQAIVGLPWLRKAGVTIDYEHMRWNGRPLYPMGSRKKGGVQLQTLKVAPEYEKKMAVIVADYPSAFSRELRNRSASNIAKAIKCSVQLKDPNCRPVKCRERRSSPKDRSEEHTSELQSRPHLVCRLLLEKNTQAERRHAHLRRGAGAAVRGAAGVAA